MDAASSIGLGLDIAGGTIIAIGLLGKPATLALRATSFWGENAPTAVFMAESRADAEIGIPTLACGFLGQLVGLAWAAHVAVAIGAALAAACAVVPLTFWNWYWRPRRTKTLTIEIAHYNVKTSRALPERLDKPALDRLASMGPGLGHPAQEGEANPEYVKRVFGVTDTIDRSDL